MIRSNRLASVVLSLFLSAAAGAAGEEQALTGHWEGTIRRNGKEWRVGVDIREGGKAVVDLPDAGSFGVVFSMSADAAHVRLERKDADVPPVIFDGWRVGESIRGLWQGLGLTAEIALERKTASLFDFREEEVRFRNGGVTLAGTLLLPGGTGPVRGGPARRGRYPAVVCIHGSGAEGRTSPIYRSRAVFLARHALAALIYDKRGVGQSTGDWRTASFDDLAGDALAGVRLLRSRRDIDGKQIGLTGSSQGGWVAPLAASKSKQVKFLILGAAAGVSPAEQAVFHLERQLREEGYSPEEAARAASLRQRLYEEYRRGAPSPAFREEVERARGERWFGAAGIPQPLPEKIPGNEAGTLFFDPAAVWQKIKRPVLVAWGEEDNVVPVELSRRVLDEALRKGGNKDFTLRVFPRANHTLIIRRPVSEEWDFPRVANGYFDWLAEWLRTRVLKP